MNNFKRRWYDDERRISSTLELIKNLDSVDKQVLAENLTEIVKQIKELHKEEEEPNLSLGINRVLGLYKQASHSRRWYDADKDIGYAMKTLFTLPNEDILNIIEGLSVSLRR